jgi:hypothetical protein
MFTGIEKIIILIDLLNDLPNVEFKMVGVSKPGIANISKAKIISNFGIEIMNTILSMPPNNELVLIDGTSLIHYTVYDKEMFAIKNNYNK